MAESRKLEFGGALTETLGVIAAKAKVLVPLSLALYAAPTFAIAVWALTTNSISDVYKSLVVSLGVLPFSWILAILVTRLALSEAQRAPEPFIDSVRATPALILPVFALGLISSLGIGLGFVLLIVPGVILGLVWMVAIPARVAEPLSITAALGRSVVLTRDNRFRLLGLFLIYWLSLMIASYVTRFLVAAIIGMTGASADVTAIAQLVGVSLIQGLGAMVGMVGATVLYVGLRTLKEGGHSRVAEVFA